MRAISPAQRARRLFGTIAAVALLALAATWAWHTATAQRLRMSWQLARMPAPTILPMPVDGVAAAGVAPTFGAARGSTRRHAGVDIFASRGTVVRATTPGIVAAIRDHGLGGRQVWLLGPALQRHYYAHLDAWSEGLAVGQVVAAGTPLGQVGNTGNARNTPSHLHYGIYAQDGAYDPLPLLQAAR